MTADSEKRALAHERVRRQHSAELAQDYVEAIYEISLTKEPMKVSSLVKIFGVSHVTVIRTLKRLKEQGFITGTRSKHIALTKEGKQMGEDSAARHELLRNFFYQSRSQQRTSKRRRRRSRTPSKQRNLKSY